MDIDISKIVECRHYLHSVPEIAFSEFGTAKYVADRLEKMGIQTIRNVGGTGVVGILRSENNSDSRNIAIRSELDALPIEEENSFNYKSHNDGYMHACGHDGHMAMVLGTAEYFSLNKDFVAGLITLQKPAQPRSELLCLDGIL